MLRFGFLIDNRKCIGCHACTVACKQEHEVPLGRFRTWVKYVEEGEFPRTQRHFSVMRCNHCEHPPCVEICPVTALYKRDDGIVDFDPEVCIGCKSCMQACPYDALYIEPDSGSAHKCNFCAHRIENDREPPCVTVCPEQAIVMGDLDNPDSVISRLIADNPTTVRSPEKGTRPKLFYIDGSPASLDPLAAPVRSEYVWSQSTSAPIPLAYTEEELGALATRSYDVGHEAPWGWKVSAYLWTKSIAAGGFLVPILLWALGLLPIGSAPVHVGAAVALLFLLATTVLLVVDLKRPHKFLSILLRPQKKSWLVKGSYVLIGYGAVLSAFLATGLLQAAVGSPGWLRAAQALLLSPALPLSAMTAAYTAWLFKQCVGRDLWHSRVLPQHLVAQAVLAGSAVLLLIPWIGAPVAALRLILATTLLLDLAYFLPHELTGLETRAAQQAAAIVTRGVLSTKFWRQVVIVGHVLPLLLLGTPLAPILALAGLLFYEQVFIVAGQAVPLS